MPEAKVKERGLIAHDYEVNAILKGTQTQFRRPMEPQPKIGKAVDCTVCGMQKNPVGRDAPAAFAADSCSYECKGYMQEPHPGSLWPGESQADFGYPHGWEGECPFGNVGDRLWVKETVYFSAENANWYYSADNKGVGQKIFERLRKLYGRPLKDISRPSALMPRWASRIIIEVTDVRLERVQDISSDDAQAEGVRTIGRALPRGGSIYIAEFADLWDSINKKRGFGWDTNPWAWVVTFQNLQQSLTPSA